MYVPQVMFGCYFVLLSFDDVHEITFISNELYLLISFPLVRNVFEDVLRGSVHHSKNSTLGIRQNRSSTKSLIAVDSSGGKSLIRSVQCAWQDV